MINKANEEYIRNLKKLRSFHNGSYAKSIDMAISALSAPAILCGTCKYVDVPRNRKPCCSCYWLERESYYEEVDNEIVN